MDIRVTTGKTNKAELPITNEESKQSLIMQINRMTVEGTAYALLRLCSFEYATKGTKAVSYNNE